MHLVTFQDQGQAKLGAQLTRHAQHYVLDLHQTEPALPGDMLAFLNAGEAALALARQTLAADNLALRPESEVTLLAPVPRPGKIICVGHNYVGHIGQDRTTPPEYPTLFCKPATVICGPEAPIIVPRVTTQVDFEAELAVIVGRCGRHIPEAEALDYVAGYAAFNDVSARDYQKRTSQWMLGKAFDTFGPLGPALVTADEGLNPHALELTLTLNGVERQRANTRDFIFSIPYLIYYISTVMTLEPGDVIATGTPAKFPAAPETPPFMQPGDVVAVTLEHIGTLTNPVVAEATRN
jgi:2-keto-4-pentenoate hydratase/2-oxohepta-3-ene-1,7-dioic acid hydratase in catechol pathway